MKKFSFLLGLVWLFASFRTSAQVTITYEVDITEYLASGSVLAPNGIRIGGSFTPLGVQGIPDWVPSASPCAMTNVGNNKWQIAITYPPTAIGMVQQYKFVNGNWGTNETSDSIEIGGCGANDGQGNVNRRLTIPPTNQTVSFCWDKCRACHIIPTAVLTTGSASAITQTTATVSGEATGLGITARGICYATSQQPTIADSLVAGGSGAGTFSADLTELLPNTTYYARAYATNGGGTSYGNEISFTTLQPTVQTFSITYKVDITNYVAGGATLGANGMRIAGNFADRGANLPNWTPSAAACAMVNEGNNIWSITVNYPDTSAGKVQLYKFVNNDWGTNEGSDSLVAGGCGEDDGQGNINRKLILPIGGATYSFCYDRCFACFIPTLATVTTTAATNIGQSTATVGGEVVGTGISARGICYSTSPLPTTLNSIAGSGTGTGTFSGDLTGLLPNTTYYARAYGTNGAGTAYGNEISFTTQAIQTIAITYKVDITNYLAGGATLGANGMRIAGNFADRGASLPNWTPSAAACAMVNEGNNIWSITVNYPDTSVGKVQLYKFVNNDWGTNEGSDSLVAGGCGENDGQGNINRKLILPTGATSYSFCYDRCFACFIPTLANVTTTSASNVGLTTASVGGNVTGNGITEKGICYGTSQLPTTANSTVSAGAGSGSFSSDLMGLSSFTTYYARAFATNQAGTSYGNEISFITLTISVRPVLEEGVEAISPNPFSGEINISFSEKLESTEFVLVNVLGETILEGQLKNGKNRFVLSTIPSGIYLLKIKGIRKVYRLVKE